MAASQQKNSKSKDDQDSVSMPDAYTDDRRNFVAKMASVVIGATVGLVPFIAGVLSFMNPLSSKNRTPEIYAGKSGDAVEGYVRVTTLDALSDGGAPQRFPVIDDKFDAWNFTPDQAIGAVYVRRQGETVTVFNATCPHAGCSVQCDGTKFVCPCHNSAFNLDGTKTDSSSGRPNPSPRSMDELETRIEDGQVWVDFKNFYTGRHEKVAKA